MSVYMDGCRLAQICMYVSVTVFCTYIYPFSYICMNISLHVCIQNVNTDNISLKQGIHKWP